jgi:hypothetical protein
MNYVKKLERKHCAGLSAIFLLLSMPAMAQLSSGAFRGPSGELDSARQKASSSPGTDKDMKKLAVAPQPAGFYGLLDLRHTSNDYYDESGELTRRDPALHGKLRIGGNFYNRSLDISLGVGAAKLPASQRVYQKRPDITVDVYPLKGQNFNLLVYGNALFPVRSEDLDPTEFADGDRYDRDYRRAIDATVIALGVAPNLKLEKALTIGRPTITLGADAWTRMYSKPIYISESDGSRGLGLVTVDSPVIEKPFEDRAMRYVHQETLAIGFTPAILPSLNAEIAGYSESRYLPQYSYAEASDSWSYSYVPERISFTRFKLDLDLTRTTTISNELYFFRNGFFAQDRVNDQRRFRNIIRLAIKL